jgi:hypothetical protein
MADNITITQGSGTTIATDDVSGVQYQVVKISAGADGVAGSLVDWTTGTAGSPAGGVTSVQGVSGGTPAPVTSVGYAVATVCTSGTTAYVATDVVGGAKDFGVLGPSGASVIITTVQLMINLSSVTSGMTSFTLHLFNVTPPSAIADSSPFTLASGDRASYLGSVLIGTPVDLGDTLYVEANGVNKQVKLSGTKLFGYLTTNGAYTPTAVDYTVTIHTVAV